jgi:hypothetical protein
LEAEERGGAHWKASWWRTGSAAGKRRWQDGVGITGGVRAVGEEVLSDAVLGVGQDGRRRTGAGCPWWLGSTVEELRRWSGGAVKCAGKEDRGAPNVGAELGVVTGSSEGDRGGVSQ